ncbi:MAG: class I SAM-dependent methyltransferase [Xanthomonadaceae bacterium]|nr:class I SAM-dependent methyltransferase [Xanthomonadaceae bacterium]
MSDAVPPLVFTGERYHPDQPREIAYEHWHRYAFAQPLAQGRRVLDAACGEGYGAALLAGVAASVLGVDLAAEAVAHARTRYRHPRLRFAVDDATRLAGVADASIDLVVSFETLEHLADHDGLLAAFARVLAPGGLLLLSTPDRRTYSELPGHHNPHHVRELDRAEFEALLGRHFPCVRLYGQRVMSHSVLWRLDDGPGPAACFTLDGERPLPGLRADPVYHLAACAREEAALAALPALSCFADAGQSLYAHYQQVLRELLATDRYALVLRERLRAAGLPDGP